METAVVNKPTRLTQTQTFAGLAGDDEGSSDQRPPLVLLHGLTFDRSMWQPMLARLRQTDPGRRVLSLDLPGHGESTGNWCYDGEAVCVAVHQAVLAAGLHSPVVVGHSYSGILATFYAARYPTRGVVNVDQPLQIAPFATMLTSMAAELRGPGFPGIWQMLVASMHFELLPAQAQDLLRATCRPTQELVLAYWRDALDRPVGELTGQLKAELSALRTASVPYHVFSGHEPEPAYRQWLADSLPQATMSVWPDSGHFPHLAHPDRFADCLKATTAWTGSLDG